MSNIEVKGKLTPEQLELVKATIAKGATDDEFKLFIHRCETMGLDPLKSGQIHFVKYGNSPGTIVVGIDGFRTKAANTGKHKGTKRGVIRSKDGVCIGAWCEVYRSDWTECAREEVSLNEYNTGKAMWSKMPETMIKKVAEVAALRMAFPDELGGLYSDDEMSQAEHPTTPVHTPAVTLSGKQISFTRTLPRPSAYNPSFDPDESMPDFEPQHTNESVIMDVDDFHPTNPSDLGSYIRQCGKQKGKRLSELNESEVNGFIDFYKKLVAKNERISNSVSEDYEASKRYIDSIGNTKKKVTGLDKLIKENEEAEVREIKANIEFLSELQKESPADKLAREAFIKNLSQGTKDLLNPKGIPDDPS